MSLHQFVCRRREVLFQHHKCIFKNVLLSSILALPACALLAGGGAELVGAMLYPLTPPRLGALSRIAFLRFRARSSPPMASKKLRNAGFQCRHGTQGRLSVARNGGGDELQVNMAFIYRAKNRRKVFILVAIYVVSRRHEATSARSPFHDYSYSPVARQQGYWWPQ